MKLSDLSASELARIDAICLDFEADLRAGKARSIDALVVEKGGAYAELLRQELEAVEQELQESPPASASRVGTQLGVAIFSGKVELPKQGTAIGPYTISEMLGRGGMGVVFKAIDQRLDREVAIKILAVDIAKRRELKDRFEREAKAVAALSHPNIVELFDIGVTNGLPYAVMEYLDGDLLDQRFKRGAMDAKEVRRLGAQIADALAAAHSGGVIHRDLKPHNIMLVRRQGGDSRIHGTESTGPSNAAAESTIVKLFDFGLSRVPRHELDAAEETAEGIVLGTPGYMAPEQARGESVTPAADIFSLGCVLFEAFYGKRAFAGETSAARFKATIHDSPQADPIRRRDDFDLANLIDRCLQKDARERPESASAIASQLRQRPTAGESGEANGESSSLTGAIVRRHALALLGGAVVGGVSGVIHASRERDGIENIKALAVLSFNDDSDTSIDASTSDLSDMSTLAIDPIGEKDLHRGEKLAALLVHELTRLSGLNVPRFRPMRAETPRDFRRIGAELEVDAILTGSMRTVTQGTLMFLVVDFQIISAKTGSQLWSKQIQTDAADNYLQQSKLATEIASAIGRRLTSTAEEAAPPSVESFSCLVDGKTRSDPESTAGLEKSLKCFEHAHSVDRQFADPIAGIALTSITLAAQSPTEKSLELIVRARQATAEALALDPTLIDARLAGAMLDWQTTNRYEQAERTLRELSMIAPNNWQVLHQYGLLQLATGQFSKAFVSLREASQINPWSVLVKVDRARAIWFSGNAQRAVEDAKRIRDKYNRNILARGLLVDLFEHLQRYDEAIAEHDDFGGSGGESDEEMTGDAYLRTRREHLAELPYGPFGAVMNEAILQVRMREGIDEFRMAEIAEATPPMLPLLISSHPSFGAVRLLERAKEILPVGR